MRVKITLEVKMEHSMGSSNPSQAEMDKIMRGCITGIVDKYRGKVDGIMDTYNSVGNDPQFYGCVTKSKSMQIAEEEDNKTE